MNMTVKTPTQLFINGKFFCLVERVEIKENSPEFRKSILPDNARLDLNQHIGTIVNIIKTLPTKEELEERAKVKKESTYNAFYHKMVSAVDDPEAHLPIE